jgi:hypothetical protein
VIIGLETRPDPWPPPPLAGRCPVCVMVCPARVSWEHPGRVRVVMHTHPAVAHEADLLHSADVVMICIGTGTDVRPYTGPLTLGEYTHAVRP